MEFKFRSADERLPPPLPPSSAVSYLSSEQAAFQGQTAAPITSTMTAISTQPNFAPPRPPAPSIFRSPDMRLNLYPTQNPRSVCDEMIERQLEKEMIREEIIAAEIPRRWALEAEVRRELMLEREIAMRRPAGEGLGFDQDRLGAMRLDHRVHHPFDDDRFTWRQQPEPLTNVFTSLQAPPPTLDLNNKDKLIVLAKPDPNLSGDNRKTPITVSASELPPFGLKMKPKEEWSCALCRVSATNEKGLISHINGKKHQAKEAMLRAQKLGSGNAQSSKKAAKVSEPKEINGMISTKSRTKQVRKSLDHNETSDVFNQKMQEQGTLKEEWSCALCRVSATNEKGLISHINGKKHQAKEAMLRAQKTGSSSAQSSKKAANFSEPKEIDGMISTELRAEQVRKSLDHNETSDISNQKMQEQGTLKEEWSCALCHVSATSEKDLIPHINGKKHQAKEAMLRAQKTSSSNAQSSNKAANFSEPKVIDAMISTELRAEQVRKSLDHNETSDVSNQKMQEQGTLKEEWRCALCHVSATSEKDLIPHINGKKHQAKEAMLRAQKTGSSNAQSSKKAANFSEPKEIDGMISTELRAEQVRKSLDHNETSDVSNQKMQEQGTSKEEKEEPPMLKDQCGEVLKNKGEVKMVDGVEREEDVKKQKEFKFWCESCKVSADNPKVWSSHLRGKKHIARSQELTQNDVPIASFMASLEASKEAEVADTAKEVQEKVPTATAMASSEARIEAEDSDAGKEVREKIPTPTAISSADAGKDAEDADTAKEAMEKFNDFMIELMRKYNSLVAKEAKNSAEIPKP